MDRRIPSLVKLLDQAYNKHAWHGTTLRGSLRGLTLEQVLWRPGRERHNIWELVLHAAYWKFCIRRQLTGLREERFGRAGSDWLELPAGDQAKLYKADVALLDAEHRRLRKVLTDFPASRLDRKPAGREYTYEQYVHGIASHDLYHAGQIQLIKRLFQ